LNKTTGKDVGIYPELKGPSFHAKEGQPMEKALLSILGRYGYTEAESKCFVQCFEEEPLRKMRKELGSKLPQIMLMGDGASAKRLLSPEGLADLATFVNGIGPSKGLIEKNPSIVKQAHEHNLAVHPYTFRADSYPERKYDSFDKELNQFFNKYEVDGIFTDFPDQVSDFLKN
jgi:glycerophosphoryl diester phosphodiesterase